MAITNQQIIDFLLTNPGMSDADIVKAMETYGVSPAQMAEAVGVPVGDVISRAAATVAPGNSVTLGDTRLAPQYDIQGSGQDQQIGGITNILVEKTTGDVNYKAPVGSEYQTYGADGTFQGTGVTQKVDNLVKEFVLGSAALFGGLGGGFEGLFGGGSAATGAAGTVGTTGLTMGELAQLDLALGGAGGTAGATSLASALTTGAGVGTLTNLTGGSGTGALTTGGTVAGMGTGTGLTAGAGGLGLSTTGAGLGAAGTGAGITAGTGLGTGVLAGSGLGTTLLGTGAGTALGTGVLAGSGLGTTLAGVGTGVGTGLGTVAGTGGLTAAQLASLLSTGLTTGSGLLQQQTSREAAIAAQGMIDRETTLAKQSAQFRPVGMTTRFGSSQFQVDPVTGQLISAGYTLSPEAKNAQDRLVALAGQGLTQAEAAQAQFAPLQTAAQSLYGLGQGYLDAKTDPRLAQIASQYLTQSPESKMLTSLGSQYIAQSPQEVAQNYLNQQMALLQPGREQELANLQNRLQQQGRGGLSVAQGGTLGATTPELQALFNARAQQEAQLAAQAQQAGQQQVQFGAGLVGTGQQLGIAGQQFGMNTLAAQQALEQQRIGFGSGLFNQGAGLMGQYYGGQQAAYAPYTTALGQVQGLETAAQQPLQMGANLGQTAAQAGFNVGQLGLRGAGASVELATGRAATTNPYSTAISGLAANPAFGQYVGGLLSPTAPVTAMSAPATTFGTGNYYGQQDLGLFL